MAGEVKGHAACLFANGNRHEGTFVDSSTEGHGTFTFGDDNASWEGTWSDGSAIGIGTWRFDCDEPAGGGTGQLHFSGDGPTDDELRESATAAPTKWAQVAAEKAAAAQEALIESKPSVTNDDGANDGGGDDNDDDDDEDDEDDTASSVVASVPASQCESPIADPQPTHDTDIDGGYARGCHQCSTRKTRAGAKLKLKWCSACMCARYCSEECQAADWREHKGVCHVHCAAQLQQQ